MSNYIQSEICCTQTFDEAHCITLHKLQDCNKTGHNISTRNNNNTFVQHNNKIVALQVLAAGQPALTESKSGRNIVAMTNAYDCRGRESRFTTAAISKQSCLTQPNNTDHMAIH